MDKTQAQEFISNALQSKFDPEQYTLLVRNLLNNFEHRENNYQGGSLWEAYREHISQYRRIGKYTDPNGDAMDILIVEVKSLSKLDRARTSLRNFVVKHLQTFEKDYAIAAFYSKEDGGKDWRFSFVKIEIESERTEEGKIKARKELTPAKRYSFLVGAYENSYTAQRQLLPLLLNDYSNPTIEEIENAFSIEKVTDEFFEQYKELYLKLSENKDLSEILVKAGLEPIRFTKKLLGQIVFLYFLQKKGWLGVPKNETWGKGDKKYMQNLFNEALENDKNYFRDYLQYLFYEALAKDRRDTADPVYYRRFDCKIPFLNGGLFEADYDWEKSNIIIPNNLFRNEEKNKAGDKGTGIFDVFDRYNFTIKEDEPLEKEVAVDPEMLGKVFENMLEIKERKSKGAYYTPREIVHYMCQESLINYIDTAVNDYSATFQAVNTDQLNIFGGSHNKKGQMNLEIEHKIIRVPKEDIELFIRKGYLAVENDKQVLSKGKETDRYKFQLPESIQVNADLIDEKLTSIKICDPAIGSGAFPVGLLHEIVIAQKVLLHFLSSKYLAKKLETIELKHEEYKQEPERYIYKIKRHAIQESIYGVDIDTSAIDIARLRLWLSLIVDEIDFYNIEALPNLDYKIVLGNSLIGLPDTAMRDLAVEKELEDLKEKFFNQTNDEKKKQLRQEINQKIRQLLDSAEQFAGYKIDFDFKLFFSEVWHHKGGFDIVIGNPPYIQLQDKTKISTELLLLYKKQNFETFIQSGDIYNLFYEKGLKVSKNDGLLLFITSNRFCFTNYGKSLREFLSKRLINKIINLNKVDVFTEANVGTLIISVSNQVCNNSNIKIGEINSYPKNSQFVDIVNKIIFPVSREHFKSLQWGFYSNAILSVKNKIIKQGIPLDSISDLKINRGITTGLNDVFVISLQKASEILISPDNSNILKPVLKGADIKRWCPKKANNLLIYTYTDININSYPEILTYLNEHKEELSNVYEAKNGSKKWYELRKCSYYNAFSEEKIIWTRLSSINSFAISKKEEFSIDSTSFAIGNNLKYYCSILNSSIVFFYFKLGSVIWGKDGIKWFGEYFDNIPIRQPKNDEHIFDSIFDYLFELAKHDSIDISKKYLEYVIDGIVFELYFPNEIKAANKEIIKHLGDLKQIYDSMSDEEKMAIIQAEFNRLYDPNHPVRNNLETLDSVEEVRIIKEVLK